MRFVSHPLVGSPSQSPQPAAHRFDADALLADAVRVLREISCASIAACAAVERVLEKVGTPAEAATRAECLAGSACAPNRAVAEHRAGLARRTRVPARPAVLWISEAHRDAVRIDGANGAEVGLAAIARDRRQVAVAVGPGRYALDVRLVGTAGAERAAVPRIGGRGAPPLAAPVGQTTPHAPQLRSSFCTSMHLPAQYVIPAGHPHFDCPVSETTQG